MQLFQLQAAALASMEAKRVLHEEGAFVCLFVCVSVCFGCLGIMQRFPRISQYFTSLLSFIAIKLFFENYKRTEGGFYFGGVSSGFPAETLLSSVKTHCHVLRGSVLCCSSAS